MGRFRDMWASGKLSTGKKSTFEDQQEHEALEGMHELSPDFAVSESSRLILDSLKSKRGQETGRWLRGLIPGQEEIAKASVETAAPATTAVSFDQLVVWIDGLFKQFIDLSYEFNKSAVGTDLLISYEPPKIFEKKSDEVWYKPVTKSYKGRLTTRFWALIVHGQDSKISMFLVPSTMLLAFNAGQVAEDEMPPFMEIAYSGSTWTIGGEAVSIATIPHLAKELLGDLIRVASGKMSETELFGNTPEAPALGQNMAVGYAPSASPRDTGTHKAFSNADLEQMGLHEACDVVDHIVEHELKMMYDKATKLSPGSPEAAAARKKISAIETFRSKVMEAFEEYAHMNQLLDSGMAQKQQPEQLARKS